MRSKRGRTWDDAPPFAPDFDCASGTFSGGNFRKQADVRKSTIVRTLAGSIMA